MILQGKNGERQAGADLVTLEIRSREWDYQALYPSGLFVP